MDSNENKSSRQDTEWDLRQLANEVAEIMFFSKLKTD